MSLQSLDTPADPVFHIGSYQDAGPNDKAIGKCTPTQKAKKTCKTHGIMKTLAGGKLFCMAKHVEFALGPHSHLMYSFKGGNFKSEQYDRSTERLVVTKLFPGHPDNKVADKHKVGEQKLSFLTTATDRTKSTVTPSEGKEE
mmetsp:Transcript_54018/g.135798  ORF Transcript_54018/g.135798 Transcript_54018/m.135798 type:complete len:142 (+) Transcript_54018:303-728(+)